MPNVRIATNWKHPDHMEWVGAPTIDKNGILERGATIPGEAYTGIEEAIHAGHIEGDIYLADESRFHWFLDR